MSKTVVISGSGSMREKLLFWTQHFESLGYEIIAAPKPWNNSKDHDNQLKELYVDFYDAIDSCDIFFLMNEEKNGVAGYIGVNGMSELIYATVQYLRGRKDLKVYLANTPSQQTAAYDEVNSFLRLGWAEVYTPVLI